MTAGPQSPLRADARHNREKILAAARTVFMEAGPDASMEDIARAAKVGVGTLYRRFPDWESLVCAVAKDTFERVGADARAAAIEEPSAWDALIRLFHTSHELRLSTQLVMRSARALRGIQSDATVLALREELLSAMDALVRAAQDEGQLRHDIGTGDVAVLYALTIQHLPALTSDTARMAAERCTALIVDAIGTDHQSPLPGRILTQGDIAH